MPRPPLVGGSLSRAIGLALRGLWWRRWSSVAILLVGVACTGVAASTAALAVTARDAVFQSNLRLAPTDTLGTGVSASLALDGTVSRELLSQHLQDAFAPLLRAGYFETPVVTESDDVEVYDSSSQQVLAALSLVYRDRSCAHVVIVAGRCLDENDPHGVVITEETALSRGWTVGTSLEVGSATGTSMVRVRGIYEPVEPASGYWFATTHSYFGAVAQFAKAVVPHGDAVLVSASYWDKVAPPRLDENVTGGVDFPLDVGHVHQSSVARLESSYAVAAERAQSPLRENASPPSLVTTLPTVLGDANAAVGSTDVPIYIVGVEVLVLTWLVLYVLLLSSAAARTSEIVLGKLRGLTPAETGLHALLEPLALVAATVPVGVGAADIVLHVAGPSILGSTVTLSVPGTAWAAAVFAGLGGVIATMITSVAALRRSVIEQWRRAQRRPRRVGWVLETVVATLALAGVVELVTRPASGPSRFLPLSVPALLAIAGALIGARLLPRVARMGFRRTRGSTHVALFLAVRQIGRRPGEFGVFVLVTVAVAQLVFGFGSRSVIRSNELAHALTETGAAKVLSVTSAPGVDPSDVVARLDPSGKWASAVYAGGLTADSADDPERTPSLLVVDPTSFGSVGYWRSDFGSAATLADELKPLQSTPPTLVYVKATTLTMSALVHVESDSPVELHVGLTDRSGTEVDAVLATIDPTPVGTPPTSMRLTASIPDCADGCFFRRFALLQTGFIDAPPKASITITTIEAGGSQNLLDALRRTTWTSPDTNRDGTPILAVRNTDGALSFTIEPAFTPIDRSVGYEIASNLPAAIPALVTRAWTNSLQRPLSVDVTTGSALRVTPSLVDFLPRLINDGVLISRAWLPAARPDGYDEYRANEVWLDAAAPSDFVARLAAAGVSVRATELASSRGSGPGGPRQRLRRRRPRSRRRRRRRAGGRRGRDHAAPRRSPALVRDRRDSLTGRPTSAGGRLIDHRARRGGGGGRAVRADRRPGRSATSARPATGIRRRQRRSAIRGRPAAPCVPGRCCVDQRRHRCRDRGRRNTRRAPGVAEPVAGR